MTLHDTLLEATTMSFWKNQCGEVHASTHPTGLFVLCPQPCISPLPCFPWAFQEAAYGDTCMWHSYHFRFQYREGEAWEGSHLRVSSKALPKSPALQPTHGTEDSHRLSTAIPP